MRVQQSECLNCKRALDAATAVFGEHRPTPGDYTICVYCGHLMVFAEQLALREPTHDEMIAMAGNREILAMQRARKE